MAQTTSFNVISAFQKAEASGPNNWQRYEYFIERVAKGYGAMHLLTTPFEKDQDTKLDEKLFEDIAATLNDDSDMELTKLHTHAYDLFKALKNVHCQINLPIQIGVV